MNLVRVRHASMNAALRLSSSHAASSSQDPHASSIIDLFATGEQESRTKR